MKQIERKIYRMNDKLKHVQPWASILIKQDKLRKWKDVRGDWDKENSAVEDEPPKTKSRFYLFGSSNSFQFTPALGK